MERVPYDDDSAAVSQAKRRRITIFSIMVVAVIFGLFQITDQWVLGLAGVAAPIATIVGVTRYRPKPLWPWMMILGAFVLFIADGIMRAKLNTLGNLTIHRSIVPDLLALPGYASLMAGLYGFLISRSHAAKRRFGVAYDGLIAALALLAVSWVYLIEPILSRKGTPNSVRIILVTYPAISIFMLIVTFQIAFASGHRRTECERFIFISIAGLSVGDMLYMFAELHLLAPTNVFINIPYIVSYVGAAAAMLDPSMKSLSSPELEARAHWTPLRVVLVAIGLSTPSLLLLRVEQENFRMRVGLFVTVILLSGIAILQIVRALQDVERSESKLMYQATHDALTGLPNRRFLERYLEKSLVGLSISGEKKIGALFLDLDRFKLINDTLGHAHGDALLIQVARRLQASVRSSDLVTRIGGDEFVIVLGEAVSVEKATEFANSLRRSFSAPFCVAEVEFVVSASIGLAFAQPSDLARFGLNFGEVEDLLRDADTAMYQAKEGGRDSVAVYEESMRSSVIERVELERDLRQAALRGELQLVYQPIVAMNDHQVLGMEALVRWAHPIYGVLLPDRFIHLAEETELINEIGTWVLDEALRELAICRKMPGMAHLTISVNLSVNQLRDGLLIPRVVLLLANHGLDASALCLELTESEIIRDPESAIQSLKELRELGITLAIDDFGTQYSSLSYLQRLPIDVLKIDRSFVEPLREENTASESLVAAIVAMSNALGIRTVVEGVETIEQARRLRAVGCSVAQGYFYARPARSDQLVDVLSFLSTRDRQATIGAPHRDELIDDEEMITLGHGA